MLERIADKSSFAAIDPVFSLPPASRDSEPFDAALSRAAASPRSERPLHQASERERPPGSARADKSERAPDRPKHTDDTAAAESAAEDRTESHSQQDAQALPAIESPGAEGQGSEVAVDESTSIETIGQLGVDEESADKQDDEVLTEGIVVDTAAAAAISAETVKNPTAAETAAANANGASKGKDGASGVAAKTAGATKKQLAAAEKLSSAQTDASNPGEEGIGPTDKPAAEAEAEQHDAGEQAAEASAQAAPGVVTARANLNKGADAEAAQPMVAAAQATQQSASGTASSEAASAARKLAAGNGVREPRPNSRTASNRGERAASTNGDAPTLQATTVSPEADSTKAAAQDSAVADTPKAQAAAANPVAVSSTQRENAGTADVANQRGSASRLGQHRGSQAVRPGDGSNAEAEVQRVRLVQRVARAFQTLGEGGGEVRLRLSPPSLGSIRLEVTLQAGVMAARIETETASARALIVDNLPALRERLATHDIKVSQFDVELAADSHQQGQFAHNDAQHDGNRQGMFRGGALPRVEPQPVLTRAHVSKGELDVLI